MAIELTPRRKSRTPLITAVLGIVAVFLILAFIGSYLYFYIVNKSLVEKIQDSRDSSIELDTAITNNEAAIMVSQRRIDDFSSLFQEHRDLSNVFKFIDENTIPSVWFYGFELDKSNKNRVIISGKTSSFFVIEQQISVFKKHELVKRAELSDINIDEKGGFIDYSITVTFNPQIFAYVPPVVEQPEEELVPEE